MKKRFISAVAALACGAGAVVAIAATGTAASALNSCNADANGIYNSPSSVTSAPGTLLACRSVTLSQVPGSVSMKAWQVQYASIDSNGNKVAVSGTVAVPTAAWTGKGTRPVIAFNPGTLGLGSQCAFSKQLAGAYQDEYEGDNIASFLKAGFAVAATDGIGYLNGQVHPYVVGANAAHAMLDIARTATQVPGDGLSAGLAVGLSGYSEGGQASLWAAQLAASYAPDLNVVGDAAGGVPGDLKLTASQLEGGAFFGFLADAVVGIITSHPSFPVNQYINSAGTSAFAQVKTLCLLGTLGTQLGGKVENFTTKGLTLDQLYALADPSGYTVGQYLDSQKLGVNIGKPGSGAQYTINFPVFQYRGAAEEVINTKTENATRDAYCKAGIQTQWNQGYAAEHLTTDNNAIPDVTKFFTDRFNGKSFTNNCWVPSL
ncbi:triacylglycerol lipase [Jatrophihabitans sp. GAS493]|nr:triacylglycerol lipase [Jatrophihabitans sp. GAS493]